jgi:FkbM family methyltransferase
VIDRSMAMLVSEACGIDQEQCPLQPPRCIGIAVLSTRLPSRPEERAMPSYGRRLLVPKTARKLARELGYLTLFSDPKSWIAYRRCASGNAGAVELIELRVRQLANKPLMIRPTAGDTGAVFDAFVHKFHVPARGDVPRDASVIIDLGSHIGSTMAHFACLYPKARILGVEMDGENARLCRRNIAHWPDRCSLIEAAIWSEDGEVEYQRSAYSTQGFAATSEHGCDSTPNPNRIVVRAYSVNRLLGEYLPVGPVDYVKMDIEGAESGVLSCNTEWLDRVGCIKVECHGDYTVARCMQDLARAGLRTKVDAGHWASVIGSRARVAAEAD